MALSDSSVRTLKPTEKPFKVYDRDGLFLLVNPNGLKLWRWRYRFDGKEKLMAIGEYPIVRLAQARERRFAEYKKLDAGIDPMAERKAEAESRQREAEALQRQAESSFENIARKWWEWCLSASLPAMPITFCGAWKPTYFRPLDTSSFTT